VSTARQAQTIDQLLARARARLVRLGPGQAMDAVQHGAVLVDIRPQAQRAAEGEIPGAMIVERNVLEWRFDPAAAARLPVAGYDLRVIVVCSEGYTSSLAAASCKSWACTGQQTWRAGSGHGTQLACRCVSRVIAAKAECRRRPRRREPPPTARGCLSPGPAGPIWAPEGGEPRPG